MNSRISIFLVPLALVTACARADVRRADTATAAAPVVVDRPVLVAFFAVTQAQVDSSEDTGEALSDFQYYLPALKVGLDSLGVAFEVQYTDTVRYSANGRTRLWVAAKDSADVGYVLLRPDAEPRVQYAVATSGDVLDQVREWLGRNKR